MDGSLFAVDSPALYKRNAARYGDLNSFLTPNGFRQFQFNHPDLIAEMLVHDAQHHLRGVVLRRARGILGDGLLTSEEPIHLRQRRLAQPAFHRRRLASYAEEIVRTTREMCASWPTEDPCQSRVPHPHEVRVGVAPLNSTGQIELHAEMVRLTLRITSRCLLGTDVNAAVQTFVDSMSTFNDYLPFALLPGAPLLEKLPIGPMPGMRRALAALDDLIFGIIRERRQAHAEGESYGDDLLAMLLEAEDESGTMSDRQARDEALTILLAGHETTANALTFLLWLVARDPALQQQIRSLVEGVCRDQHGDPRPPEAADYPRLAFLEQVYAESMRLYPPAWVVARTALRDYTMRNGQKIPKGAHLIASQLVVHHDPRWWPDPTRFDPARFTPEAKAARPKFAYFPFGGGARYCIGEGFAWMEGVLMLATIVQNWQLTLPDPADGQLSTERQLPITPKFTIRPRDLVPVLVHRLTPCPAESTSVAWTPEVACAR